METDENNPLTPDELNSELTGLNKGQSEANKKQLMIIIGAVAAVIVLIVIVIIVVAASSSSSKSKKVQGEIKYVLDVSSFNKETAILGDEFDKKNYDFDIFIDDKLIKYSKKYAFDGPGKHNVTIKLYGEINMDYMFKGVEDMTEVNLTSTKKCQITSMISTFEKCSNLYKFRIEGFGADKLKSMSKLFYRTRIYFSFFVDFDTKNLEDISYMYANTNIERFSLNGLNTKKVTNMSHLFQGCPDFVTLNTTGFETENVKDMSYMFSSCTGIKYIDINSFKTSSLIDMSHMFQDCISLTNVYINKLDTIQYWKC